MAVHFHPQPKPRPRALQKLDRRKALEARDTAESAKVKVRSGGRCEAVIDGARCGATAWQIHHRMGGRGVRGLGMSAKAQNKLHLCAKCHHQIHAHVLIKHGNGFKRLT